MIEPVRLVEGGLDLITANDSKAGCLKMDRPDGAGSGPQAELTDEIDNYLKSIGFDLVHAEFVLGQQRVLRVFIERPNSEKGGGVTLEDCATVSRGLSEFLDQLPVVDTCFGSESYDLEVSSPGVDRPLRKWADFVRFQGKEVRIQVIRPLTETEISNADYFKLHSKQKKFVGVLGGVFSDQIKLLVSPEGSFSRTKKGDLDLKNAQEITIPFELISKANLEPRFD
jgi:ribosome maturation factor RimP